MLLCIDISIISITCYNQNALKPKELQTILYLQEEIKRLFKKIMEKHSLKTNKLYLQH